MAEKSARKSIISGRPGSKAAQGPFALPKCEFGTKMTIALAQRHTGDELLLSTNFEGIDKNGMLLLAVPIYNGTSYKIPSGEVCALTYTDNIAIYRVQCRVKRYITEDNIRFVKMEMVNDVQKIQRRDDFRLPVSLPSRITRHRRNAQGEPIAVTHDVTVLDISAGGAKIMSDVQLRPDEEIGCAVALEGYGVMKLASIVKWGEAMSHPHAGRFRTGLQFKSLSKAEDDAIVKYIFSEQFKRRNPSYRSTAR